MRKLTAKTLALLGLVLVVTQNAAAQQSNALVEVGDGVYAFGKMATTLVIVSGDEAAVIDPVNAIQAGALRKELQKITDATVKYVIYSHNHWDHISGAQIFSDEGALVLSHSEAKQNIKPHSQVVIPDVVWDGDRFDLSIGETTIELHHFGPSHGSGMTVFLLPDSKLLFLADIATADRVFPMHMPNFDIDGLVATIDAVEQLVFDAVVFGHGTAAGGSKLVGNKNDIVNVGSYLDDLIAGVGKAMSEGGFMAVNKLELPKWKHFNRYDEWFKLNATRIVISKTMGH